VSNSSVSVNLSGVSTLDKSSISEFHGLGTLSSKLSRDNNFASTSRGFHNEANNSITSTANGKSSKELVLETFCLSLSTKTTVHDTLGIKLNGTIIEIESLLNKRGQLTDALSLLSENVLSTGGTYDNVGAVRSGADLNTGVTILSKLTGKELIELGVEASVCDELALGRHFGAVGHHLETEDGKLNKKGKRWV
jgi:hypothetical protein